MTDSSGNALAINTYDEYGIPASGNLGAFQYTGQVWLPELGMYHYKARMYSPTLGRFMQTDPIGYGDGMNMYAYVGNDPVNFVDPTGLIGGLGNLGCEEHWSGSPENPYMRQVWSGNCNSSMSFEGFQDMCQFLGMGSTCAPFPDPTPNYQPPGGSSNPPVAGGEEPQRERSISPCMQSFLADQGLGSPNLGSVRFHEGDGGSLIAKTAFWNGNPAITIGNDVYVKPGHWSRFAPGTEGYFEEVVHSIQYHVSGTINFMATYAKDSIFSGVFGTGMHDNPIEAQAIAFSRHLASEYKKSGKTCS